LLKTISPDASTMTMASGADCKALRTSSGDNITDDRPVFEALPAPEPNVHTANVTLATPAHPRPHLRVQHRREGHAMRGQC